MTREEAIRKGDMYCPNCGVRLVPESEYIEPTQSHGRLIDADALSEKLCETTIFIKDGEVFQRMINDAPTVSAEAVQTQAEKCDECIHKGTHKDKMTCKECVSAEAVQGWIPCSERLPSESGTYLTTTAKGSVCTDHYYANSTDVSGRHWSYRSRREPIAWTPLPTPYKGGEDE